MKLKHLLCLAALAFETVAFAQVTISGNVPQSNSTYTLPVTLSAKASSPNTISGWAVYFGNTEYYSSNVGLNGLLDVSLSSAPTGPNQQVTITAFDNAGAHTSYVASKITVVASPLPTPPQSATSYINLQVQANPGWNSCLTNACSGSSSSSTCSKPQRIKLYTYKNYALKEITSYESRCSRNRRSIKLRSGSLGGVHPGCCS